MLLTDRRNARRLAVWNAALWALGNGLASTTLVVYLARELKAEQLGLGIGFILAAPQIIGLLRIAAPMLIAVLGSRKAFSIGTFLLGAATLAALPWVCTPGRLPSPTWSLAALVMLWCLHHLFQYLGTVALWSWLADIANTPIRGRFLGWRERWLVAGQALAAVVAGLFVWGFQTTWPESSSWSAYAIAAAIGAAFMTAAVWPLCLMHPGSTRNEIQPDSQYGRHAHASRGHENSLENRPTPSADMAPALLATKGDSPCGRFLRLLCFGCWFSFFNGITQAAQNYYPMQVLGISLLTASSLQTGMRLGQCGICPWMGRLADQIGNRPVMVGCQLLVAAGLLCMAAATPQHWTWLIGAWVLWIAYAGMNVCLPNLLLKLSPPQSNTSYIAVFYALTGVCYAAATLAGGTIVDHCGDWRFPLGGRTLEFFTYLFFFGWAARSLGALWLLLVVEPRETPQSAKKAAS